jgi:hypothetical protein
MDVYNKACIGATLTKNKQPRIQIDYIVNKIKKFPLFYQIKSEFIFPSLKVAYMSYVSQA